MFLSAVASFVFVFPEMAALASYTFIAFGVAGSGWSWRGGVWLEGSSLKYAKGANIRQLHTNSTSREDGMLCYVHRFYGRIMFVLTPLEPSAHPALQWYSRRMSSRLTSRMPPLNQFTEATPKYPIGNRTRLQSCIVTHHGLFVHSASVSTCLIEKFWTEPDLDRSHATRNAGHEAKRCSFSSRAP